MSDVTQKSKKALDVASMMELIYEWLRMLPRINKYFLEQEAKIKTDKLVMYLAEMKKAEEDQLFKSGSPPPRG